MSSNEVELERDHYWWLHPAIRGRQAMPQSADSLPWRWLDFARRDAEPVAPKIAQGPYGDFAKLLYKLNGYRPGPVNGWYIIMCPEPGKFAVGQLWVDPEVPVVLFREHVYADEARAREVAAELRRAQPGLLHRA